MEFGQRESLSQTQSVNQGNDKITASSHNEAVNELFSESERLMKLEIQKRVGDNQVRITGERF